MAALRQGEQAHALCRIARAREFKPHRFQLFHNAYLHPAASRPARIPLPGRKGPPSTTGAAISPRGTPFKACLFASFLPHALRPPGAPSIRPGAKAQRRFPGTWSAGRFSAGFAFSYRALPSRRRASWRPCVPSPAAQPPGPRAFPPQPAQPLPLAESFSSAVLPRFFTSHGPIPPPIFWRARWRCARSRPPWPRQFCGRLHTGRC